MAHLNNVRDGRSSKVYLLSFGSTAVSSLTSADIGKLFVISKKDSSSSAFGNLAVGDFFFVQDTGTSTPPTLGTDDKLIPVTPKFLGGATDKDINFEKSTTDITCDKDNANNVTSNGIVSISGSITAMDLVQTGTTAANEIRQRFNKMVEYTAGVPAGVEADRTLKDVLMFVWDARDLTTGEYVAVDFVPAFLTSQAHGSAYGSGQTFNVNFSGADTDEAGHRRSYQQVLYTAELAAQMALWDAA